MILGLQLSQKIQDYKPSFIYFVGLKQMLELLSGALIISAVLCQKGVQSEFKSKPSEHHKTFLYLSLLGGIILIIILNQGIAKYYQKKTRKNKISHSIKSIVKLINDKPKKQFIHSLKKKNFQIMVKDENHPHEAKVKLEKVIKKDDIVYKIELSPINAPRKQIMKGTLTFQDALVTLEVSRKTSSKDSKTNKIVDQTNFYSIELNSKDKNYDDSLKNIQPCMTIQVHKV